MGLSSVILHHLRDCTAQCKHTPTRIKNFAAAGSIEAQNACRDEVRPGNSQALLSVKQESRDF